MRSIPIGFFQAMAALFLAITLAGFAPTFFLRPWFDAASLPIRFHIHGFFMTCWIVLFLIQTVWIARGNVAMHRRTAAVAAVTAGALLVSALAILYFLAAGYPDNGRPLGVVSATVWGNIATLVTFCIFVGTGIAMRAHPQIHKRLMLYSVLSMMGPSLARIGHFEMFRVSDSIIVNDAVYGLGGVLALYLLVAIHDRLVLGRLHGTLLWAVPLQFGLVIIAGLMVAGTGFGQGLILLLA